MRRIDAATSRKVLLGREHSYVHLAVPRSDQRVGILALLTFSTAARFEGKVVVTLFLACQGNATPELLWCCLFSFCIDSMTHLLAFLDLLEF